MLPTYSYGLKIDDLTADLFTVVVGADDIVVGWGSQEASLPLGECCPNSAVQLDTPYLDAAAFVPLGLMKDGHRRASHRAHPSYIFMPLYSLSVG
jgi:hypothetical protein